MKRGAEVVVIGAGVSGCSIAYHLAKKGCRDVVVVDRDQIASGASGRCPGGFRHQWGTRANVLLMSASIRMFLTMQEELDFPQNLEVRQNGYLFLAYTDTAMEQFRKNVRLQQSLGIPVEMLDPQQARSLVPQLSIEGLLGATFCPWDGRANPYLTTHAYALAARRLGVEFHLDTPVIGLASAEGRMTGVITNRGTVETSRVVCAAGPHTPLIAGMAGVKLAIEPMRRQALISERVRPLGWPALMSLHHGVSCFQTGDGGLIAGIGTPNDPRGEYEVRNSWDAAGRVGRAWGQLVPVLRSVKVLRVWTGLYDMTPDAHPILAPAPGVEGLWVAAGFSGHGFMMGPITGKLMAEMVLGEPTSIDVSRLDAGRFDRGDLVIEPMVK